MAGKIPRAFIDELIARVDLVELIHARVPLKKAGVNYLACCPFHNEKSPSFNVNREKQFYHCFGCGVSGNAISFLMDYERQSFVEAVETLADSLGLPVPRETYGGGPRSQDSGLLALYETQAQAADWYARQLREHPEAGRAREYLQSRGLSGEIARQFLLGYAPPGWRSLPESLGAERLLAAGLAIAHEGGSVYDRFRDRIMFPIRDRRGRVIGFGGRVMGEDKPKYLNSPETATFKKNREVYGLYELLASRHKPERIVVVEGYMDVIALAQHGIPYAVATLGTATSADHAVALFRYAPELVFCFDGDNAGRAAAWKALEASLPALREGRSLRFLLLPQDHDPDSLVREEGRERFEQRLEQAQPLSDYLFGHLSESLELGSIEGRAALFEQASPLLAKLPEGVFRELMLARLSELAGHQAAPKRPVARGKPSAPGSPPADRSVSPILRTVLARLIQNPSLFAWVDAEARSSLEREEKAGPLARKLFAVFDEKPDITLGGLRERFRGEPEQAWVEKLGMEKKLISETQEREEFPDALRQYLAQARKQRLEYLLQKGLAQLDPLEREELRRLSSKKA